MLPCLAGLSDAEGVRRAWFTDPAGDPTCWTVDRRSNEETTPMNNAFRMLTALAVVAILTATTVGCAHVKRDEFDTEMSELKAELRSEMEESDTELAADIDAVDGRVDELGDSVAEVQARTTRLETDLQAMAAEFDATVVRLEDALAFNAPIHFEFDSDEIRETDEPVLKRFAAVVQDVHADSLITVEGFTDPAGSRAYNLQLGQARAESVKAFLAEQGLDASRLRAVSYGEDQDRLVAPDAWGPGQAGLPNRRVTLVIETADANWDVIASDETLAGGVETARLAKAIR